MYDTSTVTYSTADAGLSSAILAFIGTFFVVFLIILVFALICQWRIFTKAGKPGWAAIVPVYNIYVLMDIIKKPWWWMFGAFASLIPFVGTLIVLAWSVIVMLELGRKFGKSTAFSVVGLIIFSLVGYAILAFGDAKYNPSAPAVVDFLSGDSGTGSTPPETPAAPPTDTPQV